MVKSVVEHQPLPDAIQALIGRFCARIWDMDCVLELRLNENGRIIGLFSADDVPLKVICDPPCPNGQVCGVIRAEHMNEVFAMFCARANADGSLLEVDLNNLESGFEVAKHVMFTRLS